MVQSDFGALLVLDRDEGRLGECALALVRLGVHALYANDLHEAALLARQEGRRLRAALLPSSASLRQIDESLEALAPHTRIQPASVALTGARPADADVEALRERGLRWCLWDARDAAELRFLATLVVWEGSDSELRIEPRVPVSLRASVTVAGRSRPARVLDLTTAGAFLELDSPPAPGRSLGVEIELPSGPVALVAHVRWARAAAEPGPPERPSGIGVEFGPPRPAEARALRTAMAQGMARYELR
jgi:hypothetical protein